MKIVVLDGYTLNPGDISWNSLKQLGEVIIYDRTSAEKIVERSKDAEILLTNKTPLDAAALSQLPLLQYIGVLATGYNVIDVSKATELGITVSNVPGYGTDSVVQLTFALLLELCNHVQEHSDVVRNGKWSRSPDFSFWDYPLTELAGKTIGIIGFGNIGKKVADIATAFGMNILATSKTQTDQPQHSNFKWADIDDLLINSDVVSLHCPLLPETKGLINKERLQKMKRSAFLLNTSRGPLVADKDLAEALNSGIIAGAGLDVLSIEPPPENNSLFKAKNCIITPHIAWATKESRQRLMNIADDNVKAFINGNPVNIIRL
jgi:glycerate dehydrogenase